MRYNFKKVGNRIRDLRKSKKWSQDDFVDQLKAKYLPITRKTISRIEQGDENKFTLPFLLTACDVFGCDMGYLLGEYEEHTRDAADIADKLGFSSLAADNLVYLCGLKGNQDTWQDIINYLSFLLEACNPILMQIARYSSQCIAALVERNYYAKEALQQFKIPSDVEGDAVLDFLFSPEYADIERKHAEVTERIKQLDTSYSSMLYHCEKVASAAIEKFIAREAKRYGNG